MVLMNLDYLQQMFGGPPLYELEGRLEWLEIEVFRIHLTEDHRLGPEYTAGADLDLMEQAHRTLFPECRREVGT